MTTPTNQTTGGGIGFVGALTILFIALKLTGVIAWSWIWVLSPIWITFLLTFGIFFIAIMIAVLMGGKR